MEIEYSKHFEEMLRIRTIRRDWVQQVVTNPERIEDRNDGTRHYLGRIAERGDRWLRVVVNVTVEPDRAVTVFFDRRLRKTT